MSALGGPSRGRSSRSSQAPSQRGQLRTPGTSAAALPRRGAHAVGTVSGHTGEEVYVPRALWTESFDSPLQRTGESFAATQASDVSKHSEMKGSMRRYFLKELGKQSKVGSPPGPKEDGDLVAASAADAQRILRAQALEREAGDENARLTRAALEEQMREARSREQQSQALEAREAAEVKLRTLRSLCEDLEAQKERRQQAHREALASKQEADLRRDRQRAARQQEEQEERRVVQLAAVRGECQQLAQQERLKAAQDRLEASYQHFSGTMAGEASRRAEEERRQDREVERHQELAELHYSRREAAREKQRLQMIEALGKQVEGRKQSRSLVDLQKQADRDAANESAKRCFDQDLQRLQHKKRDQLQLQKELVEMMAKKQEDNRSHGRRPPPALSSMQVTPALLADVETRAASNMREKARSSPDLSQQMDAARFLAKPCGRPVGLGTSPSIGLDVQSEGKRSAATSQSRHQSVPWHRGLTAADMKVGMQAASKRVAIAAADKADS